LTGALLEVVYDDDADDADGASITIFFVTTMTTGRFGGRWDRGFDATGAAAAVGRGDRPNNAAGAKKLNVPAIHAQTRTCCRLARWGLVGAAAISRRPGRLQRRSRHQPSGSRSCG
jgi:hypothetical protein